VQIQTDLDPAECVRIFQDSIRKRPLTLLAFPFRCEAPEISENGASILASFQIGEPYGMVQMQCECRNGVTFIDFETDGNIRGKLTANSMAKNIASKLASPPQPEKIRPTMHGAPEVLAATPPSGPTAGRASDPSAYRPSAASPNAASGVD